MSFKKKMAMGALSATLGLSLVAGGTWAAFNDIENTSASVAAGELDLVVARLAEDKPYEFNVSDLKPGDYMERAFNLVNDGSLAIKDVLMSIEVVNFENYIPKEDEAGFGDTWAVDADTNVLDYLDQFKVQVFQLGEQNAAGTYPKDLLLNSVSLKDFYLASETRDSSDNKGGASAAEINQAKSNVYNALKYKTFIEDNRLIVSTMDKNRYYGIPAEDKLNDLDKVLIKIEFDKADDAYDDGTHKQNKFQGDSVDIKVALEATQWHRQEITEQDLNGEGYITTNEKANNGENF